MTSRKPCVVTIAAGGRRRVISAFVATVVPWEKSATSPRSMPRLARRRAMTPSIGIGGVEAPCATSIVPLRLVEDADVGEGAADVDGDPKVAEAANAMGGADYRLKCGTDWEANVG